MASQKGQSTTSFSSACLKASAIAGSLIQAQAAVVFAGICDL